MGPRRTTLTFSSDDAPALEEQKVFVYYCKYSGKHVLTTDCNLSQAPRRRTDHALVIDTSKHVARLYNNTDGGVKLIRRRAGAVERQYRVHVGKLPFAYRTEPEGRYLYILDGALTTYTAEEGGGAVGQAGPPLPPCITATGQGGAQVILEVDDRGRTTSVLRVAADAVRVQVKAAAAAGDVGTELVEFLRGVLGVRLGQLALGRGTSARHKVLLVEGMAPGAVFAKLRASVAKAPPVREPRRSRGN